MANEILYNVPVFPLNTVLFPSMPLPLHIFEPRYRDMVLDLRRGDSRFCVALIREGLEVGGPADPHDIACLAEAVHVQTLPDGRYFLVAVGVERVKILSTDAGLKPYLVGSLETWPDDCPAVHAALMEKTSQLFEEYADLIMKLAGQVERRVPVPTEPDLLSYIVASALQIEPRVRQRLLEIPGSDERLRTEAEMLETEVLLLRAFVNSPDPPSAGYGQFSAN
jgi:hypothetical protein